ncbi:molybdate ABC transporter permease subunit [Varunaivibrio sulfuroxidans]|uniref:Molybdenum transport system permease n=1 Tax=Varunaivibrio sulfuroxidans TaxID=1773489 RepID=A0A4R3J771_9PROT|nr:molybdate ABC transporter permease subunit [Varunaivibrio sulfuroxidans]TCS61759.1 molybdate transport system permease protein [Varunaivibrio sulfuroxidans]WES32057.1 molybdate ABC transporter permease subunit [Varunaivibrio sulfuroxidans]
MTAPPGALDLAPLWLSFRLAGVTLGVLLAIALPLAWWLAWTRWRGKVVIETLVALPMVLPPTVLGFYLLVVMGPEGALGRVWRALTGSTLTFTFAGLVIASCVYSLPFVVQPLIAAFKRLDRRSVEASCTLGAPWWRTFALIVVPGIRGGILVAAVQGFAHTLGEFGVVLMVGGNIPGATRVVSIAIFEHVETLNYEAAGGLSLVLVAISFALLMATFVIGGERARRVPA